MPGPDAASGLRQESPSADAASAPVRDDRDMASEEFTNAHPALAQF